MIKVWKLIKYYLHSHHQGDDFWVETLEHYCSFLSNSLKSNTKVVWLLWIIWFQIETGGSSVNRGVSGRDLSGEAIYRQVRGLKGLAGGRDTPRGEKWWKAITMLRPDGAGRKGYSKKPVIAALEEAIPNWPEQWGQE